MGCRCLPVTGTVRSVAPKGKTERSQSRERQQGREGKCTDKGPLFLYLAKNGGTGLMMETRVQIMR